MPSAGTVRFATGRAPLQLAWGMLDPVATIKVLEAVRELRPQAPLTELPDLGHYPQIEDPPRLNRSPAARPGRLNEALDPVEASALYLRARPAGRQRPSASERAHFFAV